MIDEDDDLEPYADALVAAMERDPKLRDAVAMSDPLIGNFAAFVADGRAVMLACGPDGPIKIPARFFAGWTKDEWRALFNTDTGTGARLDRLQCQWLWQMLGRTDPIPRRMDLRAELKKRTPGDA